VTSAPAPGRSSALPLYITDWHACSYLEEMSARTLFVDPLVPMDGTTYEALLDQGFRRSGPHVYRPACGPCQRCVPVRLPVWKFSANRSQRRNLSRNRPDVTLRYRPAQFDHEQYMLYRAYVQSRHAEGSMAEASLESYQDFLVAPWGGETHFLELRLDDRLMAVAVTDRLPGCLSAVYTFFDPALTARAPGTYAVLCQIEETRRLGLRYLYLGYWIAECRKMSYKDRFRPMEARIGERWRRYDRGTSIA
jgi:arginine-tRNA-protein transferase